MKPHILLLALISLLPGIVGAQSVTVYGLNGLPAGSMQSAGHSWQYNGLDGSLVQGSRNGNAVSMDYALPGSQMVTVPGATATAPRTSSDFLANLNSSKEMQASQIAANSASMMAAAPPIIIQRVTRQRDYKAESDALMKTLSGARRQAFLAEGRIDFEAKKGDPVVAKDYLAYLRLWIRTHPEPVSNPVESASLH